MGINVTEILLNWFRPKALTTVNGNEEPKKQRQNKNFTWGQRGPLQLHLINLKQ